MLKTRRQQSWIRIPKAINRDSVASVRADLVRTLNSSPGKLLIDCSELEHVVSSHINLLWQIYDSCHQRGVKVRLDGVPDGLLRVLEALDLAEYFCEASSTQPTDIRALQQQASRKLVQGEFTREFAATVPGVADALDGFMLYLEGMGLPAMLKFELKTVFYEIATNIRTHAELTEADRIDFTASCNGEHMELRFVDRGVPFDLTRQDHHLDVSQAARNGQLHGFGLAMINRLSDRMTYSREGDGMNVLIVEKVWSD